MRTLTAAFLTAAGIALMSAPASAQQTRMLSADRHNEYGLVYTLPLTSLRIDVSAKRTVSVAGPYRQYAKRFIGKSDVVEHDGEQWQITDVKVIPVGVPDTDPESQFLMQLKPGAITQLCVADNNMLLAINKEVASPDVPKLPATQPIEKIDIKEYLQYVNEDFLASQSTAKQAQMLSESLMEIRDSKVSLTRGTAETMPTDGRQLELMLKSLQHQEEAVTAAFAGASATQTVSRSFTFMPDEEGRSILFRLSDFAGFVGADDYSGDPVYIRVSNLRSAEIPVDDKGEEKKLPKNAVMYNIPGTAHVEITLRGATLWSGDVELAQAGVRFGLDPTLFSDKKVRSAATFNPATGAIVNISEITDSAN